VCQKIFVTRWSGEIRKPSPVPMKDIRWSMQGVPKNFRDSQEHQPSKPPFVARWSGEIRNHHRYCSPPVSMKDSMWSVQGVPKFFVTPRSMHIRKTRYLLFASFRTTFIELSRKSKKSQKKKEATYLFSSFPFLFAPFLSFWLFSGDFSAQVEKDRCKTQKEISSFADDSLEHQPEETSFRR
jgi:hypothetical protein